MQVTELSAAHAGKTVRVTDDMGQVTGTLETVSFEWGEGGDNASWATGVGVTKAKLTVNGWHVAVLPTAQVEILDHPLAGHEGTDCTGSGIQDDNRD